MKNSQNAKPEMIIGFLCDGHRNYSDSSFYTAIHKSNDYYEDKGFSPRLCYGLVPKELIE